MQKADNGEVFARRTARIGARETAATITLRIQAAAMIKRTSEFFFFQAEDGIRDYKVTGVQTCALPIYRVSIGVQSFQPHLLRVLERRHDPAHIRPAVEAGLNHIGRVSVDLIFAVPGQTLDRKSVV